ncbi:U-box domain-containing protein, partial [Durusdinium trenchii]
MGDTTVPGFPPEPAEPSALLRAFGGVLLCPITQVMFRDPVFIPESGNTYERSAIETY